MCTILFRQKFEQMSYATIRCEQYCQQCRLRNNCSSRNSIIQFYIVRPNPFFFEPEKTFLLLKKHFTFLPSFSQDTVSTFPSAIHTSLTSSPTSLLVCGSRSTRNLPASTVCGGSLSLTVSAASSLEDSV